MPERIRIPYLPLSDLLLIVVKRKNTQSEPDGRALPECCTEPFSESARRPSATSIRRVTSEYNTFLRSQLRTTLKACTFILAAKLFM
jgi:hypothetical protein